jgi:hypothetical protein
MNLIIREFKNDDFWRDDLLFCEINFNKFAVKYNDIFKVSQQNEMIKIVLTNGQTVNSSGKLGQYIDKLILRNFYFFGNAYYNISLISKIDRTTSTVYFKGRKDVFIMCKTVIAKFESYLKYHSDDGEKRHRRTTEK